MTAAATPARGRATLMLFVAALLTVAGFWALSQTVVSTWLERDALQRAQWWLDGRTPWQWDFAQAGAVIVPGNRGVEVLGRDAGGLRLRVAAPAAGIALALRGESIDPTLVQTAELTVRSDTALRAILVGERDGKFPAWAAIDVPAGDTATLQMPLASVGDVPLRGLQLRTESARDAEVDLVSLALLPAQQLSPGECDTFADIDETLRACPVRLARFIAPSMATTDRLLWWRDQLLAQRPGAVVTAALGSPSLAAWLPAAQIRGLPVVFITVAFIALVVAAGGRRRRGALTRRRVAFELLLVLLVPFALLAAGWPGDDVPPTIAVVFALSLATALILRDPDADWRWVGDAAAWRASTAFTLLAGAILVALGLWLSPDSDARTLTPDRYWRYPLWAALQQWLLIRTIAPRTRRLAGSPAFAALAAGALFALLHLPNFGLMFATFIGGTAWAWLGYRHRALLPLIASHAVLGLLLVGHLPPWLLRSAEVGGRYLMAP